MCIRDRHRAAWLHPSAATIRSCRLATRPRPALGREALEQRGQAEVPECVCELHATARLEVRQQVEAAIVESAVAAEATQRDDAVGVVAAAAGTRGEVGRIDAVASAADEARHA